MTTTNMFQGLSGEERNSSRVLRPPGGGHTDVLGLSGPAEPQQQKKANIRNVSSITEGTNFSAPEPPKQVEQPKAKTEQAAPVAPQPAGPAAAQRVRVPPGGFSSGLW